jgi:DNA adenine methylase
MTKFQSNIFGEKKKNIVNVSQVPKRSPFRYPGGKTWLIPEIREWLNSHNAKNTLIEPFAGGGIVSLTAVFENLVDRALMVELDENIAAVWKAILGKDNDWLSDKIINFDLNIENAKKVLSKKNTTIKDKAFSTILRNRILHGGILANGAGLVKKGENGKGLHSRWYPDTLSKRIKSIKKVSNKIDFLCEDGFDTIKKYKNNKNVLFFIDPPYTVAGKRLYAHFDIDHEELFKLASKISSDFLMTYDDTEEVRNLSKKFKLVYKQIPMRTTHNTEKFELLISKNLDWYN